MGQSYEQLRLVGTHCRPFPDGAGSRYPTGGRPWPTESKSTPISALSGTDRAATPEWSGRAHRHHLGIGVGGVARSGCCALRRSSAGRRLWLRSIHVGHCARRRPIVWRDRKARQFKGWKICGRCRGCTQDKSCGNNREPRPHDDLHSLNRPKTLPSYLTPAVGKLTSFTARKNLSSTRLGTAVAIRRGLQVRARSISATSTAARRRCSLRTKLACGRRSGKSFVLATIAAFLAFRDWRPHLQQGEIGTIMVVVADRRQARVIMRYCLGCCDRCPCSRSSSNPKRASIGLGNRVVIEIHTASFRPTRGYALIAGLLDEHRSGQVTTVRNLITRFRSLSITAREIPASARTPCQKYDVNCGYPLSAMVGTFGVSRLRVVPVKASAFTFPRSVDAGPTPAVSEIEERAPGSVLPYAANQEGHLRISKFVPRVWAGASAFRPEAASPVAGRRRTRGGIHKRSRALSKNTPASRAVQFRRLTASQPSRAFQRPSWARKPF